ncbi:MAG: glycosyltransferase family 4 protein [Pseudomonadota bacterium]
MTRPVRTLLFSSLYPSGVRPMHGIFVETRLRELLKTGGVETRVVAPVPWFPSTHQRWGDYARLARTPLREASQGIEVLHPRYLQLPKIGMTSAPLLMALGARGCIRRLIDSGFDFDVIDAHYYYPDGVAAALLGAWFGKPFTVTARGTDINLIPEHRGPRTWLQWAARRASASIGVSAALVERMRALAFDPRRLHVIRNGVDLERFRSHDTAAMRQDLGITGAPVVLTVGNLHEHKGQRLTLEAFALLRQRHAGAQLLVVGEGPDRSWLQARAAALGLADAVRLVGTVPNTELARWYSAADVLVLASSREGWPNVLLESMACGTPVVASDVGGVREIVLSEVAGRVLAQRTPQHLADSLCSLLADLPARTAVRGHAAQFGWQRTSEDQLALFRSLATGAGHA